MNQPRAQIQPYTKDQIVYSLKDVDSSAIIWGVGSNSLQLPIPSTCPEGFKLLMMQCWSAKTRNRPSFRQILMHIDIAAVDFLSTPQEAYFDKQVLKTHLFF